MPFVRYSLTRRNGQPQACEMCRKAKVRCDHETPVCGRCARRSLICTYHPAPLTRAREPTRSSSTVSAISREVSSTPGSHEPIQNLLPTESPQSTVGGPTKISIFHHASKQHGATHFSAIFSENQASFGTALLDVADDEREFKRTTASDFGGNEYHDGPTAAQLECGINILLNFPTPRTCEALLNAFSNTIDVWLSPTMIRHCLAQIWSEYGEHLNHPRSISKLSQMVADLCNNGEHPIYMDSKTDWINWFGGSRLRWEMLSILFSFFGRAFKQQEEWDPIFSLPEQEGSEWVPSKTFPV